MQQGLARKQRRPKQTREEVKLRDGRLCLSQVFFVTNRPRDQELRFTVHDSPDYYQLKVSVFNDDKKTELIGETWVTLEQIVVPGGGKNDLWHNLNCKGRYAGEIRIELTYYDTRPKEEKAEERRQDTSINGFQDPGREAASGPRQPKQVKRRPLPADPTETLSSRPAMPDHSQSAPLPYTAPTDDQHSYISPQAYPTLQADYRPEPQPPLENRYQHPRQAQAQGSPSSYYGYDQEPIDGNIDISHDAGRPTATQFDTYDPVSPSVYRKEVAAAQHVMTQRDQQFDHPSSYDHAPYTAEPEPIRNYQPTNFPTNPGQDIRDGRPSAQPLHNGIPWSNSTPDIRLQQRVPAVGLPQHRSSLPRGSNYEDVPAQHYPVSNGDHAWPTSPENADDKSGPPPPPVHRNSGSRATAQPSGQAQAEYYPPIAQPSPLRMRNERSSISNSPLSQVQSNTPYTDHPLSTSPSNSQLSRSGASVTSRTSYCQNDGRQAYNKRSLSPLRDYTHTMPPSLVPGYAPSIVDDETERDVRERRMSARPVYANEPVPQYQQSANDGVQPRIPLPMNSIPGPIRSIENSHDRRAHRASAPITMSQAASNPRTPMRKSVSPQPGSAPGERGPSAIPFSPDSYDAYNPSLNAASNANSAGPQYNTPEQAKDALRQHEVESRLADGPIIGSDGRVIDPSDHLPTETWAPEPEVKTPKKGPQITMRFRQSPLGAQPMPVSTRRPLHDLTARPHSVSTPVYAHSPDSNTSASSRTRLQKKSRVPVEQMTPLPNTSPLAPRIDNNSYNSTPRASPSAYPLREPENYGHGSSPNYPRGLPSGLPPPIPGKIPITAGPEDWGRDALSEEIRRIDIGVGGGQSRARVRRYGA